MIIYLALVLSSIVLWHDETHGADNGCFHTYLVCNSSKANVEVWIERKVEYKRPNNTVFETEWARSPSTYIRAGKSGIVECYRPERFLEDNVSKQKSSDQRCSGSDLCVERVIYAFVGRNVSKKYTGELESIEGNDGKTVIIQPLSQGNKHNSCVE